MARRVAGIVTAIGLWSVGALLLVGAAGFLFAAVVHRAGSDGWVIATAGAIVLSTAGTASVWIGWWFAAAGGQPPRTPAPDDDAMWVG